MKGNFQGKPTGYLLAPTSIVAGHVYRWRNDCEIALAPPDLIELLRKRRLTDPDLGLGRPIYKGERNTMLTQQAGRLVRDGFTSPAEIEGALQAMNLERCRPRLSNQEVAKIASSAAKWKQPPLWITDPRAFTEDARLSGTDRHVLWILSTYAKVDSWAWPGYRTLARQTGYSLPTVGAAIDRLESLGRIEVRRSRRGNRYKLLDWSPKGLVLQTRGTSVQVAFTPRQGKE